MIEIRSTPLVNLTVFDELLPTDTNTWGKKFAEPIPILQSRFWFLTKFYICAFFNDRILIEFTFINCKFEWSTLYGIYYFSLFSLRHKNFHKIKLKSWLIWKLFLPFDFGKLPTNLLRNLHEMSGARVGTNNTQYFTAVLLLIKTFRFWQNFCFRHFLM